MKARITKIISKTYTLYLEDGRMVEAQLAGRLRLQVRPVAGDEVEAEEYSGQWVVEKVLPRRTYLVRPACANVDQALIVMSVKDPDFSVTLIDRLSFLIVHAGIEPVLIVTKCDLGINAETEARIREYENGPMKVIRSGKDYLDPRLAGILKGKISVLTGQSGAGQAACSTTWNPRSIWLRRKSPKPWAGADTPPVIMNCIRWQGDLSLIHRASHP